MCVCARCGLRRVVEIVYGTGCHQLCVRVLGCGREI
jgi:hypothetical protein